MASKGEERGRFIECLRGEGVPEHVARLVLRHAATLQRLAEAQCNGDYPADNGEGESHVCGTCSSAWKPGAFLKSGPWRVACYGCGWQDSAAFAIRRTADTRCDVLKQVASDPHKHLYVVTDARCPDCRTSDRVRELLAPFNIEPIFNGDPRGAVVKLKVPSGRTDDWGREGVCVP